jgi:hypothetical protein
MQLGQHHAIRPIYLITRAWPGKVSPLRAPHPDGWDPCVRLSRVGALSLASVGPRVSTPSIPARNGMSQLTRVHGGWIVELGSVLPSPYITPPRPRLRVLHQNHYLRLAEFDREREKKTERGRRGPPPVISIHADIPTSAGGHRRASVSGEADRDLAADLTSQRRGEFLVD